MSAKKRSSNAARSRGSQRKRPLPESEKEAKKRAIIERLERFGETITAAAAACGIPRTTLYNWRAEDAAFKDELSDAYAAGTEVLEQEAIRRAVAGVDRPVFFSGKVVGSIREYSDTLLMFVLKKRNPAFRETVPEPPADHRVGLVDPKAYVLSLFRACTAEELDIITRALERVERLKKEGGGPTR